jgi:hypothetical protein
VLLFFCERPIIAGSESFRVGKRNAARNIEGRRALTSEDCFDADLVVVDEAGSLEINGGGWAECLPALLRRSGAAHLWVVQSRWFESVCTKWGLSPDAIVDAADGDALDRLTAMMEGLLSQSEKQKQGCLSV